MQLQRRDLRSLDRSQRWKKSPWQGGLTQTSKPESIELASWLSSIIGIDCRARHFRDPFLASNALADGVKTRHAAPASPASVSANTRAPLPIACGDEYSSGR